MVWSWDFELVVLLFRALVLDFRCLVLDVSVWVDGSCSVCLVRTFRCSISSFVVFGFYVEILFSIYDTVVRPVTCQFDILNVWILFSFLRFSLIC